LTTFLLHFLVSLVSMKKLVCSEKSTDDKIRPQFFFFFGGSKINNPVLILEEIIFKLAGPYLFKN